ncbi:RDD family protein [Dehalogenimonas sp. THU2]|uniref:RDD family protein n=1 Tax=Dehalogenimonas sp. THU2 TaxID=3151121 RepID=UPI00321894ED
MSERPKGPIALEFAGFWRQAGSLIIDVTVLLSISSFLTPFHWFGFGNLWDITRFIEVPILLSPFAALINPVSIVLSGVYFIAFWIWRGQTLGMMVGGIKVIHIDGTDINLNRSIIRYLGYIISALPLFLGFLWIAFDERSQGWHDKFAETYVVKLPPMPEVSASAPPAGI